MANLKDPCNKMRNECSYEDIRSAVVDFLDSLIEFLETEDFKTFILPGGFKMSTAKETLSARRKDLLRDSVVVIAGETCSGKSTLINSIIGEEVLPMYFKASTKHVCRIKYSDTLAVITRYNSGQEETKYFPTEEGTAQMKEFLKERVTSTSTTISCVDILIPSLKLKGNVSIVDTPGVGDKHQEDEANMMLNYIHHALAIVFVLNVANAGGIQHDRVARVITHVRNSMKQMVCFCPEDVIFVLNKWDAVEESERDECFERIKTQLHDVWEEIDDSHILELSATKALKKKKKWMAKLDKFSSALKKVTDNKKQTRIKVHIEYLGQHLKECEEIVSRKLQLAVGGKEVSKQNLHQAQTKLRALENILDETKSDLQHTIDCFIEAATDELYRFLNTRSFKEKMFFGTDKQTRLGIDDELKARIENAVQVWQQNNIETILFETVIKMLGEKFEAIHGKLEDIKNEMRGIKTKYTGFPRIAAALVSTIGSSGTGLVGSLIVSRLVGNNAVAAVVAALGIGSGLLVSGLVAFDILDDFTTIREESFEAILATLSKENVRRKIREIYTEKIKDIINTFMEDELKKEITNLNKSIDDMLNELDAYIKHEGTLRLLHSKINSYFEKLNYLANLEVE